MKNNWMIEEVSNHLYGYLKDGSMQIDSFLHKADVSIDRLHDLLTLRFIKNERTIDFMKSLAEGLSSITSSTDSKALESYYEVQGEILWQETLHNRLQTNPKDRFRFITRETERTFTTDENVVLKELLIKMYHYCYENRFLTIFKSHTWYSDVMQNRHFVKSTLYQNVYMQRIERKTVSDRTITKVKSHRKRIYREAAYLLSFIRKIERGDFTPSELADVMHAFFILPTNEDVLFELYWIVQILKKQDNVTYYLMDGTNSKVTSWGDEVFDYHLYHNSAGSNRVKFHIHSDELADGVNPFLLHELQSFHHYNKLARTFFNLNKSMSYWRGRPDIVIEKVNRSTNELVELIIGEVKNTQSVSYASQGLSELINYMHRVKNEHGNYLMDTDVQIKGLLCVGTIELSESEIENVRVVSLYNKHRLMI